MGKKVRNECGVSLSSACTQDIDTVLMLIFKHSCTCPFSIEVPGP